MGKGLATRATGAMVDLLFRDKGVHRIEMLTAEANLRSRAVCERLGFRLEASRRGSHRFPGGFNDHLVYARLVTDVVPPDPPRRLLTADEFRALLERLGAAWRARQYAAAAACFAEDVSYGDPTRYALHGRAALRGFFEDDEDKEQHVDWHTIVFDAAQQVGSAEYTYEGTHRYHGAVIVRRRERPDRALARAPARRRRAIVGGVHGRPVVSTAWAAALALVGFAANSLLCRAAIGGGAIDPQAFTLVRMASGAAVLSVLARGRTLRRDWLSSLALAVYAVAFAFAYLQAQRGNRRAAPLRQRPAHDDGGRARARRAAGRARVGGLRARARRARSGWSRRACMRPRRSRRC